MMPRLVLLVACAVLLVGCGGHGQDGQKGTTVINQQQEGSQSCN